MPVSQLKESTPKGFNSPTALPETPEQAREWQEANKSWWENNPMRYDFGHQVDFAEFSREFYEEIDRRFFADAKSYLNWKQIPFDTLIDFGSLHQKDVLEIGVGNGSHAQLLAARAKTYTGIDLTQYAVDSTSERIKQFKLDKPAVKILQMDAEKLDFPDDSFDFIWSWGVIHHSSNTKQILREMRRVLRPNGQAVTMVYHRNIWNYYIFAGFFAGLIKGHLFKSGSFHQTRQTEIDGAIARFYSIAEWRKLTEEFFAVENIEIFGSKTEIIPLPRGVIKAALLKGLPDRGSRFLTNSCQLGTFLVSTLRKNKAENQASRHLF